MSVDGSSARVCKLEYGARSETMPNTAMIRGPTHF